MGADEEAALQVLMTTDTIGGVWHHALELANGLCRRGCRVTLAAMGGLPNAAQRAQAARIDGASLHARPYRLEWMDDPWSDLDAAGAWLQELGITTHVDVIHLNQFAFGALAFDAAPKLVAGHSSVTSWWRAVKREAAPARWDRYRAVLRRGLAGADLVAAPTRAMLLSLEQDFGALREAVVLPNGRDPDDFPAQRKEPLIFAAGRLWDEAKNLAALDRVALSVAWPIVVAGPLRGPQGAPCAAARVRLLGEVPPAVVADWLGRASICAHPAYYEPFGLSVLEAALAGCALVLGDIASLRELWGTAAWYVPAGDDAALAHALQRLIDDDPLRTRMAALARERALGFSTEAMLDAYLKAYRSLMEKKHRITGAEASCES